MHSCTGIGHRAKNKSLTRRVAESKVRKEGKYLSSIEGFVLDPLHVEASCLRIPSDLVQCRIAAMEAFFSNVDGRMSQPLFQDV